MENNNEKTGFMILAGGLAAAPIILIDVIFASEPQIALPKCIFMTAAFVVLAFVKFKDKPKFKASLGVSAIFLIAGLLAYSFPRFNDMSAKAAAGEIIKAAENYKTKNGIYPQKLEELEPAFLAGIPKAKRTVLWSNFYIVDGGLVYVNTPPFNLVKYDFAAGEWAWCGSETFARILSLSKN